MEQNMVLPGSIEVRPGGQGSNQSLVKKRLRGS